MKKKIYLYDTTLRDGAQAEGISFSVSDKLRIVELLDEMGFSYVEAGNPGSNPKDLDFFKAVKAMNLNNVKLVAFGSTRRKNIDVVEDANVQSLLIADTQAVGIFGKSWDLHVETILKASLEENLNMIYDTIKFFKDKEKEVTFDAEHFYDGYKNNPEYAIKSLEAAVKAGADFVCLCDTNGACLPLDIYEITKKVTETFSVKVGIHCHNDTGMAIAGSICAIQAGACQVQGTINGIGERCGNADLCTIIPNIQFKIGDFAVEEENLKSLTSLAREVSEIANITHNERAPYVGRSAFAHKGGMHIDGVNKDPRTFEHMNPELVGNERRFLMSEVAGRATILNMIKKIDPSLEKESPKTIHIIDKLKELEHEGYVFEGAEASFEMLIRKELDLYKPFFTLKEFKVVVNEPSVGKLGSAAMIKIDVDGDVEITAAEGDGPVNALDNALRKAIEKFYPELSKVKLIDYKVRVIGTDTDAFVRVLITSSDGKYTWSTVGVSTDVVEASWIAMVDSIDFKLMKEKSK